MMQLFSDLDNTLWKTNKILARDFNMILTGPSHRPLDKDAYDDPQLFEKHLEIITNMDIIHYLVKKHFKQDTYKPFMYKTIYDEVVNKEVFNLIGEYYDKGYDVNIITAKDTKPATFDFLIDLFERHNIILTSFRKKVSMSDRCHMAMVHDKSIFIDDFLGLKHCVFGTTNKFIPVINGKPIVR
jgi:hypothetical protein